MKIQAKNPIFKNIEKSLSNSSSKYDNFIFLGDLNIKPTKSTVRDFCKMSSYRNLMTESQTSQLSTLDVEISPFLFILPRHLGNGIKSPRLWQKVLIKAPHFKYFAILLFIFCFMNAYSRKNNLTSSTSLFSNETFVPKSTSSCQKWHVHKILLIL